MWLFCDFVVAVNTWCTKPVARLLRYEQRPERMLYRNFSFLKQAMVRAGNCGYCKIVSSLIVKLLFFSCVLYNKRMHAICFFFCVTKAESMFNYMLIAAKDIKFTAAWRKIKRRAGGERCSIPQCQCSIQHWCST